MVKRIKLKCPNCGRRIADYSGNSEALALLAETSEAESDVLNVKCHLCKSQISILLDITEVYEVRRSPTSHAKTNCTIK